MKTIKELTKEQKETKEKIELLLKNGVEMDEIAAELKVSKGAFYAKNGIFARFGIPKPGRKGRSGRKFKIC